MTLAGVGSGSDRNNLEAFRAQCRANAEQYDEIGAAEVAKATREAPSRIPFLVKDPRGHADFYDALARATGATITPVIGFGAAPVRSPDKPVLIMASPDERLGTLVERPKVTAGRLPRSSDASEVLSVIRRHV